MQSWEKPPAFASIHQAAEAGSIAGVAWWQDPRTADSPPSTIVSLHSLTPLGTAAKFNHAGLVKWMLSLAGGEWDATERARICQHESCNNTVSHVAAQYGAQDVLRVLLEEVGRQCLAGRNQNGATIVHVAARYGHQRVVQWLLQSQAWASIDDPGYLKGGSIAMSAVRGGHTELVKWLLKPKAQGGGGANVHVRGLWEGHTLSMVVAKRGNLALLKWLFIPVAQGGAGANVADVASLGHNTVLSCAVLSGNLQMVKWLLSSAGNGRMTSTGRSLVSLALKGKHLSLAKWLLSPAGGASLAYDENFEPSSRTGMIPLHAAIRSGHLESVQWLVRDVKRVDVEEKTRRGFTALMVAVASNRLPIVEWLAAGRTQQGGGGGGGGANLEHKTARGETVLSEAIHAGSLRIILWLLSDDGGKLVWKHRADGSSTVFWDGVWKQLSSERGILIREWHHRSSRPVLSNELFFKTLFLENVPAPNQPLPTDATPWVLEARIVQPVLAECLAWRVKALTAALGGSETPSPHETYFPESLLDLVYEYAEPTGKEAFDLALAFGRDKAQQAPRRGEKANPTKRKATKVAGKGCTQTQKRRKL
jgi:ankyrin repeat protein